MVAMVTGESDGSRS